MNPKRVRANPGQMRQAIGARCVDPRKADLDRWLELDEGKRDLESERDQLNARRNSLGRLGKTDPEAARREGQDVRRRIRALDQELVQISSEWQSIFDWFPNIPDPDMPEGTSKDHNIEECAWIPGVGYLDRSQLGPNARGATLMPRRVLHAKDGDFEPRHYAELGQRIGVDTIQAGKVSGSRFAYLFGPLASLQFAIENLLTRQLFKSGFIPIVPPLLVRERALYGTSHFPEGREQVYAIDASNVEEATKLYLVGSSEPSNFSFFADRILPESELPIRIFAKSPCFRSEAGSWGKDVRGIKRLHQFDKIELNAVCTPGQSKPVYDEFLAINEWLLQSLQLPYRVVDKCGGDAGYLATARQRDIEVWLAGTCEYMELMTGTNTTDYQAERLNIRYRRRDGLLSHVHTVNDTGCAMGRTLIAIVDRYQQRDGSILVPEVLQADTGFSHIHPLGTTLWHDT